MDKAPRSAQTPSEPISEPILMQWVVAPPPLHTVHERDSTGKVTIKTMGGKIVPFGGG